MTSWTNAKNYGAFLEKDGAGFRGQVTLTGLSDGDVDLTNSLWTYQVITIHMYFFCNNSDCAYGCAVHTVLLVR